MPSTPFVVTLVLALDCVAAFVVSGAPHAALICQAPRAVLRTHLIQRRDIIMQPSARTHSTPTKLYGFFSTEDDPTPMDRLFSCLPYILPLLDGAPFSYYFVQLSPTLKEIYKGFVQPIVMTYDATPFSGFFVLGVLLVASRTSLVTRFVRFNIQQAIILDAFILVPQLLTEFFDHIPLLRAVVEPLSNFVFLSLTAALVYTTLSNAQGQKPDKIPVISALASMLSNPMG
jgi:hypothetical protein